MLTLLTGLALLAPAPAAVSFPLARLPLAVPTRDYAADKRAALAAAVADAEGLAEWCQKNKAFLERDRAYELILSFQPDHKDARKALGYSKDKKTGEWIRKREYREPRNPKASSALEAVELRGTLLSAHVERMLAAIEANADSIDPSTKRDDLKALLAEWPDDDRIRLALGQVRLSVDGKPDRWVSPLAARTLSARAEMRELRESLRASLPAPEPTELLDYEKDLGGDLEWKAALEAGPLRLLSTGSKDVAANVLGDLQLMWAYLPKALGGTTGATDGATSYLLASGGAADAFRDKCTLVGDDNKAFWDQNIGTFLGQTVHTALYSRTAQARRDMALRLPVTLYLYQNYGIRSDRGWVVEGFGLMLVHQIAGTRLSYSRHKAGDDMSQGTDERDFQDRIKRGDADWLELGRQTMKEGKAPNLSFVLGKNSGAMTSRDLVMANALAAFLIEAKGPEVVDSVLRRIGGQWENGKRVVEGESSVKVLEDVFEAPLPKIYEVLEEWLTEIKQKG